jgi:Tfp pilus assembly protein PilV
MGNKKRHIGFSLVEVLMAVGILTVGLLLVATMFPAAIYMTTVASERTMAAIVADEAFAKIQLYGLTNTSHENDSNNCFDYETEGGVVIDANEFSYPPVDPCSGSSQYFWSAIYKKKNKIAEDREYQITVFVARRMNSGLTYPSDADDGNGGRRPVPYNITSASGSKGFSTLTFGIAEQQLVNPPVTIVDNATGKLYAVVKRDAAGVTLDRNLEDDIPSGLSIWLIPPPESGGKNAGVEVYQRIIKF